MLIHWSLSLSLVYGYYFFFQVPASINCRLLEHQRVGVKFLYGLYKNNHGGILGDDMYVLIVLNFYIVLFFSLIIYSHIMTF